MTSPIVIGLLMLVVVAVLWAMRRPSGDDSDSPKLPQPERSALDADDDDSDGEHDDADEGDAAPEHIAVTSDGLAFVPRPHAVRIAPEGSFRRPVRHGEPEGRLLAVPGEDEDLRVAVLLSAGDLVATRVTRGSPDLDPWRLDALGRDRDLTSWVFETREAADAAREMLERRVVRVPLDPDGEPMRFGDAEFEQAERELERTLNELTSMTGDEAGEERPR